MTGQELEPRQDPTMDLVRQIRGDVVRSQIEAALPEGVGVERFVRATATAFMTNPDVARWDRGSVFNALLRSAGMGLIPDGQEAALVPYKGKAQLIPMIGGYQKIAAEYGWTMRARVVYEADEFRYTEGIRSQLDHVPARPGVARGDMVAVYALAQHRDGRIAGPVVMYAEDVEKAKNASASANKADSPWKHWPERMWQKTAGRRLFKELPLAEADRERIDRVLAAELEPGEAADKVYGGEAEIPTSPPPEPSTGSPEGPAPIPAGEPDASTSDSPVDETAPGRAAPEPVEPEAEQEVAAASASGTTFQPPAGAVDPVVQQAGDYVVEFGSHTGKTIRDLAREQAGYLEMLAKPTFQPASKEQELAKAAAVTWLAATKGES